MGIIFLFTVVLSVVAAGIASVNSDWMEGPRNAFFAAALTFIIGVLVMGYYSNTDSYKKQQTEESAQEQANAQPRVIREFDGCKVYTFKEGGQWHYVTRCPNETRTERNYTEPHGKITEHKTETTITENH